MEHFWFQNDDQSDAKAAPGRTMWVEKLMNRMKTKAVLKCAPSRLSRIPAWKRIFRDDPTRADVHGLDVRAPCGRNFDVVGEVSHVHLPYHARPSDPELDPWLGGNSLCHDPVT